MKMVGYVLAMIGLACVVKHIMHSKEPCVLCGWQKATEEKTTDETESHKAEEEKTHGSRYGSNPVHY
jgi:hypothetical protein